MQNKHKVCISYSCNKKYLSYLKRSLFTLNKNSPDCSAYVDLINCTVEDAHLYPNVKFFNTYINTEGCKPIKKCFTPSHFKESIVPFTGAYANLKKIFNIYNILMSQEFNYVINMDADNLILKDLTKFEPLYDNDFDILIRFRDEPLFGDEILKRKNNFKIFDLSMINLETEDRQFREGCFIVKNNDITKVFFKYIQDNILSKIEWYGDSYWFLRAFQKFKSDIKIKKLVSNFVAYDLNLELEGACVASGYGINKHSETYKKLVTLYD